MPSDKTIEIMEIAAKESLNAYDIFQYEVSSWAKNNSFSKHNMNYWLYGDYLGIGPGAHSKITEKSSITRMIKLKKVESYMSNPLKITKIHIDNSSYDLDLAMRRLVKPKPSLPVTGYLFTASHLVGAILLKSSPSSPDAVPTLPFPNSINSTMF